MSLSAPIYILKHQAKLLSREADIPLHQALNRIAVQEGFPSWSLLVSRKSTGFPGTNTQTSTSHIVRLPLEGTNRIEFIDVANKVFEDVLTRVEFDNPETTRALWNAEHYVDNHLLNNNMLPIERDYALSLIDAFLVHYVIDLAEEADKTATSAASTSAS